MRDFRFQLSFKTIFSRGFASRVFGLWPNTCRPAADETKLPVAREKTSGTQGIPERTSVVRKASVLKKDQCGVVDEQNAKPSDILEPCYLGTDHEKSYRGLVIFEPQEFFSLTYSLHMNFFCLCRRCSKPSTIFKNTWAGCPGMGGGGGTWVFFGCVCAARNSKLAPHSKKKFP